ncbi:hypothetical protein MPH_02392 [Macrophomina phaseolina MS6]|uniref:Protein kinase domain-containing protein n=1 Tax=Macrophomina phaseolina (strain MS6) TaxID=1126212 RepID=K2SU69_MACPH|nr:hypothetical protein MPH_02392 [Macrophomina phaseolina MS6]
MPKEHKYMRVQLKKEQCRLLDWGSVVGVAQHDETLGISSSNKGVLHDVLDQQQQILASFGKYEKRYKRFERLEEPLIIEMPDEGDGAEGAMISGLLAPRRADTDFQTRFPQEGETLMKECLEWAAQARTYPRRLRWASFDKDKFEQLLSKLASFNDFLGELLDKQQMSRLIARTERTDFQIIQLNDKIDHLVEIFQASQASSSLRHTYAILGTSNPSDLLHWRAREFLQDAAMSSNTHASSAEGRDRDGPEHANAQTLAELARFKALETTIGTADLTNERAKSLGFGDTVHAVTDVELFALEIQILGREEDENGENEENRRAEASFQERRVWIEWKPYEPQVYDGEPDPKIVERVAALVALLKENSRSCQFRAPRCLGYFRDIDGDTGEARCRFGIVFEKPQGISSSTKPVNLLELLRATEAGILEKPSLTARVRLAKVLAEALERLHAVNWLHKGLRSENILFFDDAIDPEDLRSGNVAGQYPISLGIDFSTPFLSGFDYSRPAQNEELTEKPPENVAYDLYRHPLVQGSRGSMGNAANFQKAFDIYALGVVLVEIMYWQPIEHILEIDLRKARPSTILRVRGRLLDERKILAHVKANTGDTVHAVVTACLRGPAAFVHGADETYDDKNPIQAAKLQIGFNEHVVERLRRLNV